MISTEVAHRPCKRCGAPVVAAYSEGVFVECDPTPLDANQELLVVLAGCFTFDLMPHRELVMRGADRIVARPWPVLVQHQCPHLTPAELARRRPYRRPA